MDEFTLRKQIPWLHVLHLMVFEQFSFSLKTFVEWFLTLATCCFRWGLIRFGVCERKGFFSEKTIFVFQIKKKAIFVALKFIKDPIIPLIIN